MSNEHRYLLPATEKVLMSEIEIEFGLTLFKFHHSIMFYINVIDMQISIEFFPHRGFWQLVYTENVRLARGLLQV